jgi:hypothetical protein
MVYIPELAKNLLLNAQITITRNIIVIFTNAQCIFIIASPTHTKRIITIDKEGNL